MYAVGPSEKLKPLLFHSHCCTKAFEFLVLNLRNLQELKAIKRKKDPSAVICFKVLNSNYIWDDADVWHFSFCLYR